MGASVRQAATACAVAALLLAGVAFASAAGASPPSPPSREPGRIMEANTNQITSFYFGKNMQITPVPPVNETGGQTADALGVSFPRALISNVGMWTVTLTEEGMVADSLDGLSIWASSDQGAQNVRFTVQVEINGNSAGTLQSERKATLSANPEEFRIDPGSSQMRTLTFPKGTQLSFQLQYSASSSPLPVGPSADSKFHYYSDLHRSRVDFVTNPFNLTLSELKLENDRVNVTEIVKDAFGVDPLQKIYSLTFNGPTNSMTHHVVLVSTFIDPVNGSTLVWNWEFVKQGGVSSGDYAVTLAAKYVGSEVNYTNVSTTNMKFPRVREDGKGLLPGFGALEGVLAAAAVAVSLGAASRVRARPSARRR